MNRSRSSISLLYKLASDAKRPKVVGGVLYVVEDVAI